MEKLKKIGARNSNLESIYLIKEAAQSTETITKALTDFQGKIIVLTTQDDLKKAIADEKNPLTKKSLETSWQSVESIASRYN
jgi:hypothetical protein